MTEEQKINEEIEKLKKIERTDGNRSEYAKAQFELGKIYHLSLKDYEQATNYYLNVLREDSILWYATAQCYLGILHGIDINKYEQAENYYLNVSKEDHLFWYATAQYGLGIMYSSRLKKFEKAKMHYSYVPKEGSAMFYAAAQCSLGTIFFKQNEYQVASEHYKNVCFDDKESYYKAQLYLELINNEGDDGCVKDILDSLKEIDKCVLQIKEQLLVTLDSKNDFERKFAHYTKPEVLFYFLNDKSSRSKMRLSLVDLMNDPMENKVLFNWLNINSNQNSNKAKSFVTSFSFNHNSLNQFRLYGLENNINGSGVSIVFNKDFFSKEPKKEVRYEKITDKQNIQITEKELKVNTETKNSNEDIFPLPLYRCVYFDPESQYIKIAKRNKQSFYREYREEDKETIESKWKSYIEYIKEDKIIEAIRKNLKEIKEKTEESKTQIKKSGKDYLLTVFEELINLAIMPISCLIKHSAFEDEDECRIMYTTHISDKLINGPDNYQAINTTLYLDYSEIGDYINKVYLGPKCKSSHQQWIEHEITKLNDKIKVQNSTLPLQ